MDFVGSVTPPYSLQNKYILTATEYFTRWVESIPLRVDNTNSVTSFLESNIVTRFRVPKSLVFDNASYFNSIDVTQYALEKGIKKKYFVNYYSQGNGLA